MEKLSVKTKKVKSHNLRKVLPLYAKHKGLLTVLIIFIIGSGVLGILAPVYGANTLASLATKDFDGAVKKSIIFLILNVLRVLLNGLNDFLYLKINLKIRYDITAILIDSINHTKMKKLDTERLGVLAERLSSDVNEVSDAYLDMLDVVFNILTNVVFLFYIAFLNFYIFLILLGYVLVLYIVCTIRSRIVIRGRKITKKANEIARSCYIEQISAIRDVKLLGISRNITNYSNSKLRTALNTEMSVNTKRNVIRRLQVLLSIAFEFLFINLGVIFMRMDALLVAGFLVIYNYYGRIESLITFISSFKEYKTDGEVAATRIFEVIEDYEKEQFGCQKLTDFKGNITLSHVDFEYNPGEPVLRDLSISFEPGQMTAIVGKSGSGKTTILSIISKLYDINAGEILLDGVNMKDIDEESIHTNIGEISQVPYIFNTSIKQNLLFVKPSASDEELVQVLKDAQIYDDIMEMPNGIDTEIGENGVKISGGQKQRIAIARLLLTGSKVIVFDEATSSLDNSSQNRIVEMLERYKSDHTIIIVAHRLSTIVGADKIYMLDGGRAIACGTHRELMRNCAEYKKLYKLEEDAGKGED